MAISDINAGKLSLTAGELKAKGYEVCSIVCDVTYENHVKAFVDGGLTAI